MMKTENRFSGYESEVLRADDRVREAWQAGLAEARKRAGKGNQVAIDQTVDLAWRTYVEKATPKADLPGFAAQAKTLAAYLVLETAHAWVVKVRGKRTATGMYRTLADAATVTGDLRYMPGRTKIWYVKDRFGRDYRMGLRFIIQHGADEGILFPDADNLSETHVLVGTVHESDLEKVYEMMQGERWSPHGEARAMIGGSEARHTSMSVGDIVQVGDIAYFVDMSGFKKLPPPPARTAAKKVAFEGYHPEVAFTKTVSVDGDHVLLYFGHQRQYLGSGKLQDRVSFQWIADESSRTNPKQVVDPERFYAMNQDSAPLFIKPSRYGG